MKLMTMFDRLIDFMAYLAGALIVFIMLSISGEMLSRHLMERPLVWTLQFSEYSLLYIVFLGAPWLLKHEGHPTLDVLVNMLGPKGRGLINAVTSLVGAGICLIVAGFSTWTTWRLFESGASDPAMIEIPKGPLVVIIPIGSLLLSLQFLRRFAGHLRRWRTGQGGEGSPGGEAGEGAS